MSHNTNLEGDEIDLSELFAALWSHKLFIVMFTGISIVLAGYYALTSEKRYTASAIFKIEEANDVSGFSISGELGALASLAGLGGGGVSSSSEQLLERALGREFIISIKNKFSIERDPYFNSYSYSLEQKDPFWKATIKQIIGWQETKLEQSAIIENNVVKNYRRNVALEITDSGAFKLSVTHADRTQAANYANNFMEELRLLVEEESNASQELRLNYLSETLADSLQEMEKAQKNLKNYALKNSAMAQENFISDSLRLDQLRMERRKAKDIAELLYILENIVRSENLDTKTYEDLRSNHPLVDDIEFRRILGMSETISAWAWPEIETIYAVSATLRDRIKRLDVDINKIEENAKIYATSAEDLAKFTRDAKIAEATYTVLIEQVKSQSLAAGFQPNTFKVYEYATPPLKPSSPKRNMVLAMGTALGIFIGIALTLFNAVRRDVYFTSSALISNVDADLSLNSKTIKRVARRSIAQIILMISKKEITVLDEADLQLASKKIIYVMNSGGQPAATDAARLLATQSAQSGRTVLLCDTTGSSEKEIKEAVTTQIHGLTVRSLSNNLSVLSGNQGANLFKSKTFNVTIKELSDRFDQVFICTSNKNAKLGLLALSNNTPSLVMVASLRKTKKNDIKNIKIRQPIDLLLYE